MNPTTDARHGPAYWLRYWAPPVVWAAVMWVFSTTLFSDEQTSGFLLPKLRWLFPDATPRTLFLIHKAIRKAAHVFEFFLLGLFLFRGIRGDQKGWQPRWALRAFLVTACYALIDEGHQFFVPGRGHSVRDISIDLVGAAIAQATVWWFLVWRVVRGDRANPPATGVNPATPAPL